VRGSEGTPESDRTASWPHQQNNWWAARERGAYGGGSQLDARSLELLLDLDHPAFERVVL